MSDKVRVYVALYFRQGQTTLENSIEELGYARFHWAIWTESKGSDGEGRFWQVQNEPGMNSADGWQEGGWKFSARKGDCRRSQAFLGRIMIGKVPNDISLDDLREFLSAIDLPNEESDPPENCVSWTTQAVKVLQEQGCAENFDVDEFNQAAFDQGNEWYGDGDPAVWQWKNIKINYTNREFP